MINETQRRQLDFHAASEVIHEVERLRSTGYKMLGNWNLAQICDHLSKTIEVGLRPHVSRMPWIIRKLAGQRMINAWLKHRSMRPGAMTAPFLIPQEMSEQDDPALIERYLDHVREADSFLGPLPPYILGEISLENWKQLQWIHASHHLGFLIPKG